MLNENSLSDEANVAISKILNHPYENLSSATLTHKDSKASIGFATKLGEKYSANHMGFGEGRVFYTVSSRYSVGVRDGGKGGNPKLSLYKLPITIAPEKEVFHSPPVQDYVRKKYNFDVVEWLSLNKEADYHNWPTLLASELSKNEDGLWEDLCSIYCESCNLVELEALVASVEKWHHRHSPSIRTFPLSA